MTRRVWAWIRREPVRARLYGAGAIGLALLAARGTIGDGEVPLWTALLALTLGVPAVESARDHVTPWPPRPPHQEDPHDPGMGDRPD